jgi:hypothetical protein
MHLVGFTVGMCSDCPSGMFLRRLDVSHNDQRRLPPPVIPLSVPHAFSRSVDISKLPLLGEYAWLSD